MKEGDSIGLALHYFACTPDLCTAMTHEYIITFKKEDNGSITAGFNNRNRGGRSGSSSGNTGRRFEIMDKNHDKTVSFEELKSMMKQRRSDLSESDIKNRFEQMDKNHDNQLSQVEIESNIPSRRRF